MKLLTRFFPVLSDEKLVCTLLCTGIIYSLFLWPLLNSILCICLSAYWLFFCRKKFNFQSTSSRLVLLFAALYLPYVAGMFYTSNLQQGNFRLTEHIAFILFPIVFGCSYFLDRKTVLFYLTQFIFSCLITSAAGLIFGLLPDHIILPTALRNGHQYIFGNTYPYIMGVSCLLSIMIIGEGFYNPLLVRRRSVIIIFIFLSFYLLFLNVRLVSLCWLACMFYLTFRHLRSTVYRLAVCSSIVILLLIGMFKIPLMKSKWDELRAYKQQVIQLDQDASLGRNWGGMSIRIALWKCGGDLIKRHPFFGVGTGDAQDSLQQAYEDRKFYFASRYNLYNLHNQYLQTLAAFGIFGLTILISCIVAPAIYLKTGAFYRIRLVFLLIFFLICFTEVILDTNKGIIWYSFFNSIFAFGAGEAEA